MAYEQKKNLFTGAVVKELYARTFDEGIDQEDFSAIYKLFKKGQPSGQLDAKIVGGLICSLGGAPVTQNVSVSIWKGNHVLNSPIIYEDIGLNENLY